MLCTFANIGLSQGLRPLKTERRHYDIRLSEVEYSELRESGQNRVRWQQTLNLLAKSRNAAQTPKCELQTHKKLAKKTCPGRLLGVSDKER